MARVETNTLILATLAHVLDRLRAIDEKLDGIEDDVGLALDVLGPDEEEADDEVVIESDAAEAIADQLLDAADDIEEEKYTQNSAEIAESLRAVAAQLSGEST